MKQAGLEPRTMDDIARGYDEQRAREQQEQIDRLMSEAAGIIIDCFKGWQQAFKADKNIDGRIYETRLRGVGNQVQRTMRRLPGDEYEIAEEIVEIATYMVKTKSIDWRVRKELNAKLPPSPAGRKRGEVRENIVREVMEGMRKRTPSSVWQRMLHYAETRQAGFVGINYDNANNPVAVIYEHGDGTFKPISRPTVYAILKRI